MSTIQSIIETHAQAAEPVLLALHARNNIVPTLELEDAEWEDICLEEGGWEYIDLREGRADTKNEFGEKKGLERLKEALEASVWEGGAGDGEGADIEDADVVEETESEGMQASLIDREDVVEGDGGGEEDVRALESMMIRLQTVRDAGADLPDAERKKMAREAVEEVLRGL